MCSFPSWFCTLHNEDPTIYIGAILCDRGRIPAILKSTNHCVCGVERQNIAMVCTIETIEAFHKLSKRVVL